MNETRKYLVIAKKIEKDILSGKYREGENIPSVRKLAVKYKTTSLTVSKAITHLASLGYLEIKLGSGSKVVHQKDKNGKDTILLLVNKELQNLDLPINYFYKDISLSYLMILQKKNIDGSIVSYKRDAAELPDGFSKETHRCSGVIMLGNPPKCYLEYFNKKDIPLILIDRQIPDWYSSRIGLIQADMSKLDDAVHYLVSLGHTKFLFSTDKSIIPDNVYYERLDLVQSAIASYADKTFKLETFQFNPADQSHADKMASFLKNGYSASICYNDISALNLFTLISSIEKRIPDDISIVGIDDIMPSRMAVPALTTIRIDRNEITELAFNMIEKFSGKGLIKKIIAPIDTELIIRKSVGRNPSVKKKLR
jgi:DNA-binding LacI/PurR family transcriptional regulator